MDVENKFKELLEKQSDLSPTMTVVLAVSGGVDSMVLLHLMRRLSPHIKPRLIVCHVNHKLRSESDREQELLEDYLSHHNISYQVAIWEKENHPERGIEDAARRFRYTFFNEIMVEYNADILMTGHHQDDQAETVLMRLIRGGRWQRLKGIEPSSYFYGKRLVRPLLTIEKEELYAYAEKEEIPFMEDVTNQENEYTRNRFRNQIIPLMKEENNKATYHIAQTAKDIQKIQKILENLYDSKIESLTGENSSILSRQSLLAEEQETAEFIFDYWLSSFFEEGEEISSETIGHIFTWIQEGEPNTSWDLPGDFEIFRDYDKLHIRKKQKKLPQKMSPLILTPNIWLSLPHGGKLALYDSETGIRELKKDKKKDYVIIDACSVSLPLSVRNRQEGDRMTLKGSSGSKKLKDIFIDQKVPLEQRDKAYVVVDDEDEIVWLINYKESELSKDLKVDTLQYILIYEEEEIL